MAVIKELQSSFQGIRKFGFYALSVFLHFVVCRDICIEAIYIFAIFA